MTKNIKRLIFVIPFSVLYGFMFKHFGFKVTLITVLVMIYTELFIGSDKEWAKKI